MKMRYRNLLRKISLNLYFFHLFIFLTYITFTGCMKRNIFGGVGVGGGFPPESGMTKLKFSPGEFDEDIQGTIELGGILSPKKENTKVKMNFFPSAGYGIFFRFPEIKSTTFPYFGITFNLLFSKPEKNELLFSVENEGRLIIGMEHILDKDMSLFYEFPIGIGRTTIGPKFAFVLGLSFYIKRY